MRMTQIAQPVRYIRRLVWTNKLFPVYWRGRPVATLARPEVTYLSRPNAACTARVARSASSSSIRTVMCSAVCHTRDVEPPRQHVLASYAGVRHPCRRQQSKPSQHAQFVIHCFALEPSTSLTLFQQLQPPPSDQSSATVKEISFLPPRPIN